MVTSDSSLISDEHAPLVEGIDIEVGADGVGRDLVGPTPAASDAVAAIDTIVSQTKEKLEALRKQRYAARIAKRESLADVAERLLSQRQVCALLGVTPGWMLRNREVFVKPLRLGSVTNVRAPLRWQLSLVLAWVDEQKAGTDQHRVCSQDRPGGRKKGA